MPLYSILMLALGVDGIGSPKDHEAFLGVGEATIILAHRATFLRRLLLVFPFLRLAGVLLKALEELAFLIEVLDGVSMVGAWAIHELVEVVFNRDRDKGKAKCMDQDEGPSTQRGKKNKKNRRRPDNTALVVAADHVGKQPL